MLGPGTGLGAALWIPNDGHPVVLPTEAGHAALAPASDLEMALLQELRRTRTTWGPKRCCPARAC